MPIISNNYLPKEIIEKSKRTTPAKKNHHKKPKKIGEEYSKQALLVIKEALQYFTKLANQGDSDEIFKVFKMTLEDYYIVSNEIYNKTYRKYIKDETPEEISESHTEKIIQEFFEKKPESKLIESYIGQLSRPKKIKKEDLISKLTKMSKKERSDYYDKIMKGK